MATVSPLHRVIDAGKWDAEHLLGRLIILAHAAFLDAGFVPDGAAKPIRRLPKQVGRTASTLSLRYAAPQLPRNNEPAAVLRLCAIGRHVVFYVEPELDLASCGVDTHWVCTDAVALAPLLSGSLDGTVRALRSGGGEVGRLWTALTDGLSRRVLVDLCREHGVALEPTFASLPGDVKAAILRRLGDKELAMEECTSREMRRLVADHDEDLWKHRYEALITGLSFLIFVDDEVPEASWKEKYAYAYPRARTWPYPWPRWRRRSLLFPLAQSFDDDSMRNSWLWLDCDSLLTDKIAALWADNKPSAPDWLVEDVLCRRRRIRKAPRGEGGGGLRVAPPPMSASGGHGRRTRRAGAAYSPSSRSRWTHR